MDSNKQLVAKIQDLIDDNKDKINDGNYLELSNLLGKVYNKKETKPEKVYINHCNQTERKCRLLAGENADLRVSISVLQNEIKELKLFKNSLSNTDIVKQFADYKLKVKNIFHNVNGVGPSLNKKIQNYFKE